MFKHIDFQLFKHNQFILLPDCYFGDSGFNFWKQGGVLEGILSGKQASGWGRGWRAQEPLWGPRLAAAWARVQGPWASCWALWAARPLLLHVLIFFSLRTLSGGGGSTQTVKAWMPPLVSWLEAPAGVMGTGLEEGWPTWVSSGVAWARGHLGEQPPAGLFRGSVGGLGPSWGSGGLGTDAWVSLKDGLVSLRAQS